MKRIRWSAPAIVVGLGALTQCAKTVDSAPPQAPPPVVPAATVAPAPPPAAVAPVAASAVSPAPAAPAGYPMCGGQHLTPPTPPSRSGPVTVQLAPAFLDEMTSCRPEDAMPKDVLARAGDGSIDQKGDCVFASVGVSCHFHSGSEFLASSAKAEPAGQGEVHCIFPTDDPKSPRVFGAHVTCSDPHRMKAAEHAAHEAKAGVACNAALLADLAGCQSAKCCDDGTLTNVVTDLVRDGRNDVRPDFRICEQTLTIDCSLLENMSAHTANAPTLGGVGKPVFGVAPAHGQAGAKHK